MSYTSQPTNAQSLNGIITLTDGVITIEDGTISGLEEIDLIDLQVSDTATIENLVVNNQIDMTLGQIKNVSAPTDNGDATNKQFVDTNFLNKTTTTTQNVASRLTFNSTTSGQSFPIIELINAITGSNNGLYLRFFKNFNRLPNTEIGSIVFADKSATSPALSRAVQLTASIDSASNPLLNITFDSGIFNPLTISNTQTILRNNDFYIKNKTTTENLFTYLNSSDKFTMYKELDMNTTNKIINLADPTLAQDASTKNYTDTQSANTNYLKRDGSLAMLGGLNMNSKLISNLLDPVSAQDASTKNYTDTQSANTNYLLRNGTLAMTGGLNMNSKLISNLLDPVLPQQASTKYYTDNHSNNQNYLLRDGSLPMLGSLQMGSNNITIGTNNHLAFYNSDFTTDSGMKMYFDRAVGTLGTFFMDMCGSEIRVRTDPSSAPTSERVKINNNETTINNNLICNGNINLGNNTTGDTTTINSIATFNGTTSFNDDVLIESNNQLAFNSGDLSSANGMLMTHNGSVGFLDVRGTEFRVRTSSSGEPNTIRFKVNDLNTSVINNFFVDGNTTLGNDINNDTTTFNSNANFPDGSKLTFNSGADCEYQSGADLTFKNGSNVLYQIGANLTFNNIHTFNVQSYINGARINLIRKTSDFTLGLSNVENGVISDPNSSGLIITMPNTGGGTGLYWNRRHYIIKLQDGGQTKLRQNTQTTPTRIDEKTGDIDYNTAWKTIQLVFDENFSGNGKIHIISDR